MDGALAGLGLCVLFLLWFMSDRLCPPQCPARQPSPLAGFPVPFLQCLLSKREKSWMADGLCVNYTSEALLLLQKLLIIIIIIRALGEQCAEIREKSRKARPELISPFYPRISKHLDIN